MGQRYTQSEVFFEGFTLLCYSSGSNKIASATTCLALSLKGICGCLRCGGGVSLAAMSMKLKAIAVMKPVRRMTDSVFIFIIYI
jgi:hypothetical protein